ncbi:MAG: hypothetical protein KDD66_00705 [Bdellovibrionales bacterium]|nr:hypothetical protein [Bdellovibrionales bacterium]
MNRLHLMFLAAFIVSILLTAGSANAVDVMEWNSDSSPESPAKLSLETIVRRKHAAISVAGMIGGAEDSTDYYLVRRAFERPGVITVGIVSGNDVTPYNIEVQSKSDKSIVSFKEVYGNKLFHLNSLGDFILKITVAETNILLPYALSIEQTVPEFFAADSESDNRSDRSILNQRYEQSPLREGLRDVGESARSAKRVNMRSDLEPESKARFAVVEGFLQNPSDVDMYFVSQKFKPHTHLTFWVESPNATVTIFLKDSDTALIDDSIVQGRKKMDVVVGDRLYLKIGAGPGAEGTIPYAFKIWMYPPDGGMRRDAGHTHKTALPFDAKKFATNEVERSTIIRGRVGLSDKVDGYRWNPAAPSYLQVAAFSSPAEGLESYSLIDAVTGKTIAEYNPIKDSAVPHKPFIEAYVSSPVFIKLAASDIVHSGVSYALSIREVNLPRLNAPDKVVPKDYSFFKAPKQP